MQRSGLVLKALTNAPTGAIAAAATTSLPEKIGGERNWDYRFSWIRDSWLTVRCLASMGHTAEAEGFRRFIERSVAGSARDLQLMYGVGGERVLPERELTELGGYRGSRPVRVGNLASQQLQLDMYGYLVELAWVWAEREHEPDEDYWSFIVDLLDIVGDAWTQPDHGIWEMRDEPRHFVHSKVMCWVAFDRGLKLARVLGHRDGTRRWERHRNHIRRLVLAQGTSPARGCFVQSFGSEDVDASLLVLPVVGFVRYDDPRMAATADAVIADLVVDGLVRRYRTPDGLRGDEGTFIACTFWLVECLVGLNRFAEASHYFDRARATANDLGLFSEQYDTEAERALGNYPQALSHLAHIGAALALRHGPR
jgi:GH15 family glucan-1,4-alpha-glucosidase